MVRTLPSSVALSLAVALAACGGPDAPEAPAEAPQAPEAPAAPAAPEAPATAVLLNPNDATEEQLLAVPGMTPEIVSVVVGERPFSNMLEVDALLAGSLDEAAREEAYRTLFLPLDLNTASEEEILLIPGVDADMAHEFDEYRPYDAMARFRTEIGKYVDEAEVARLERYVVIR